MLHAKPILFALLVLALVGYALDCSAVSSPNEAMQCCNTMPCSPHVNHHGEDCGKAMPNMHAPVGQPSSAHAVSPSLTFFAVIPAIDAAQLSICAPGITSSHSHAPPGPHAPTSSSLRI